MASNLISSLANSSRTIAGTVLVLVTLAMLMAVAPTATATTAIMPLGDSITDGAAGSTDNTGYRRPLFLQLDAAGYDVDFVGSLVGGIPTDFDRDHEGHGGWHANQIRDNIYNWLVSTPADIVILHIGTNDVSGGDEHVDEVEDILDNIDQYETDYSDTVVVFVARIILRTDAKNPQTIALNDAVEAMVTARMATDDVYMVDMESALIYPDDLDDALHPNDVGYGKMADTWFAVLDDYMEGTSVNDLTLTSSSGNAYVGDDLFCTYTLVGAATTAATAWQKDGSPVMVAYLPMEGGSGNALLDLSGNGNNGSTYGDPVWNATGGFDGNGHYSFDGDDHIDLGNIMPTGAYTKVAWYSYVAGVGSNNIISGHSAHAFWVGDYSGFRLTAGHNGSYNLVEDPSAFPVGMWTFCAVTYDPAVDGGKLMLYRSGALVDSAVGIDPITSDTRAYIGSFTGSCCWAQGDIDDPRIYDFVLSRQQIAAMYAAGSGDANTIAAEETEIGDQWTAHVTAFSETGKGDVQISNTLTIIDSQPYPPTITSTPVTDGTIGELYSYDVDATGLPAATYSLAVYPTGMGVVEATGVITWTPGSGQEGLNDVEVVATNSAGEDTQIFQVDVAEAQTCPDQMVGYWTFDDNTASPYEDSFGDNDATCSDCPAPTTGTVGGAVIFDGATDEVQIADDGSFDWGQDDSFTVEFWMKADDSSPSQNRVIVGRDGDSTDLHWWAGYQTNGLTRFALMDVNGNGTYIGGTGPVVNDGAWHLFACVRDDAAGMNRLFIDGALVDSAAYDFTAGFAESVPMNVGYLELSTHHYRYPGTVDELAIYDRALGQSEIQTHHSNGLLGYGYCDEVPVVPVITSTAVTSGSVGELYSYDVDATGPPDPTYSMNVYPTGMGIVEATGVITWTPLAGQEGLNDVEVVATNSAGADTQIFQIDVAGTSPCPSQMVGYWRFDDNTASPYEDSLGDNDATCSDCPVPATGTVGGAVAFDGATDEVDIPDDGSFDWGQDDSFTIEFWMRADDATPDENRVIVGRDGGPTDLHWWAGYQTNGLTRFALMDVNGDGTYVGGTGPVVNDDAWHLFACVRDDAAGMSRLFIDGALIDSAAYDFTAGFAESVPMNVGYLELATHHYRYPGTVDELAIYDRALNQSEIQTHYTDGLAGTGYCGTEDVAPAITSTPVTDAMENRAYTYDVDATGLPTPTYTLNVYPAGMGIVEATGIITWMPTAGDIGLNDVEVVATNSAGADTQIFQVDVAEEPDCPSGISHYWQFEEGSQPYGDTWGTTDAICTDCPVDVAGTVGQAKWFDGVGNEVDVPDDDTFDWGKDDSFTIEFWMNTDKSTSGNRVIVGRDDDATSLHWWIGADDAGYARFQLRDVTGAGDGVISGSLLNDGAWHLVVLTRDGAADMNRLFVDGAKVDSVSYDYLAGFGGSVPINLGYLNTGGHYRYEGALDEVALYDVALREAEIAEHYSNGLAGYGYCEEAPVPPAITSTAVTSGTVSELYTYDVDATGTPEPSFSLGVFPTGMGIVEATGVITWMPLAGQEGLNDVEVVATNVAGADTQVFQIDVAGITIPTCPNDMSHYWKLDETGGQPYEDYYGSNDAVCTDCPVDVTGTVGQAKWFDGVGNEVDVPDDDTFDWGADDSFTIEFWMNTDKSTSGNRVIVGRDDDATSLHWWIGADDAGYARFQLRDVTGAGDGIISSSLLNDGAWHLVALTRDGAADMNRLFVDGAKVDSQSYDYLAGFGGSVPINLGYLNTGGHYRYEGALDEVALYDVALRADDFQDHYDRGLLGQGYCEIQDVPPLITSAPVTAGMVSYLYRYDVDATGTPDPTYSMNVYPTGMGIVEATGVITWTPSSGQEGLNDVEVVATNSAGADTQIFQIDVAETSACPYQMVGYWRFDDNSASPYEDSLGDNDATCSDCPAPATGTVGGAVAFDGATNEVDIPDDGSFDWGQDDSFTIEFWMRTDDAAPSGNRVIVGRDGGPTNLHWWAGYQTNGLTRFALQDVNGNGTYIGGTGPVVNDGAWHLFACVRDDAAGINRLFIDGTLVDSAAHDFTAGFAESVPMNVGYLDMGGYYRYPGTVDELAIYDRALPQSEIQTHYTGGLAGTGYCGPEDVAPAITSAPVTDGMENRAYAYDVDATGLPTPTYTLNTFPTGMGIVEATGIITWLPTAGDIGLNDVEVVATNSAGADTQIFQIDVAEEPDCPTGISHYWQFEEGSQPYGDTWGTTAAICADCPVDVAGTVGQAKWFDGVGNEVDVPDDDTFDWGADDSFTIEFWMNTDKSTSGNRVIVGRDDAGTDLHWWIGANDAGYAACQLRDVTGAGDGLGGPVLNDGVWHLIALARDGAADMNRLFVDGAKVDSVSYDYLAGFGGSVPINLGYLNSGTYYRYEGALDEVALYDVALRETEIAEHYSNGLAGYGYCDAPTAPDVPTMVAEPVYTAGLSNTVEWSDESGSGAIEYYAERATDELFTQNVEASGWIALLSYEFAGLSDGQIYYYHVKATDGSRGESEWSEAVLSTQDDSPPVTSCDDPGAYQNTLSFSLDYTADDATSGVQYVELWYQQDGGGFVQYMDGSPFTGGTISFTAPAAGTYDFYTVGTDNVDNVEDAPGTPDCTTIVDVTPPTVANVSITNETLAHTDDYVKDGDAVQVTADVSDDDPVFDAGNITADLTGLGGDAAETPGSYLSGVAIWNVASVTCLPQDGTVTVTVSATDPAGSPATPDSDDITSDNTPPMPATVFDAAPAHGQCSLTWINGTDANFESTVVVRKATSEYPDYDAFGLAYPAIDLFFPTSAADGDTVYDGTGTAAVDTVSSRDIYFYQAFCCDIVGQWSAADTTARDYSTSYWLGDVSDVWGSWGHNGVVNDNDILKLGDSYGMTAPVLPNSECDVGPTVHPDGNRLGVPIPDDHVEYEDLMIFAMNYGQVARGRMMAPLLSGGSVDSELTLSLERKGASSPEAVVFTVKLSGNANDVKGVSVRLAYDAALEFESAELAEMTASAVAPVFFWHSGDNGVVQIDLAVLGTGTTLGGSGDLAELTFRSVSGGGSIEFQSADVRGIDNGLLDVTLEGYDDEENRPIAFRLFPNTPNPFNPVTVLRYDVPHEARVEMRVYDVTGRLVRTLVDGIVSAGHHQVVWDGTNDSGEELGSSVYFCTMESDEFSGSGKMLLLK